MTHVLAIAYLVGFVANVAYLIGADLPTVKRPPAYYVFGLPVALLRAGAGHRDK